jgi:dethiobiotin synthase
VKDLFVTGTGTGVGKTVLSALLTAALDAVYWKPIQTGRSGGNAETDRETILRWTEIGPERAPAEAFVFEPPVSPHQAARQAGVRLDLSAIQKPEAGKRRLIIEGAGGVLVPINDTDFMLDLMARLDASIVIASRAELGTINHTLLTLNCVRQAGLRLIGVVMIGPENVENRNAIEHYGCVRVIGSIPELERIDRPALLHAFEHYFDRAAFDV